MKLPLSLIQSFVPLTIPMAQIEQTLTLLGIEVDHIHEGKDPVLELSLTPNLGHCMSALGIARELAAALRLPLKLQKKSLSFSPLKTAITIQDGTLCPRYMCLFIEGVKVGPSPKWLQEALEGCGQKSINNIVDAANYIMMKTGQPLHAFDALRLEGNRIEVKVAKEPFPFLGLDGIERIAPTGTLLIADGKKPIALAGIMGGENSAVTDTTTSILLEAAYFDPITIRKAAKALDLRTDSAQRFEKGVDPSGIPTALFEAAELMGGKVVQGLDLQERPFAPRIISYRIDRINQILGTKLALGEVEDIFTRLQLKLLPNSRVEVPLFRADLAEEIDLIEEVARLYGYNNIDKKRPLLTTSSTPHDPMFLFEQELRMRLCGLGLFEFLTPDLISPALADIARMITPPSMEFLKSSYSKSEEYSYLRTSLLPGLLHAAKGNLSKANLDLAAFEIGRIHFLQKGQVTEPSMAAILLTGKKDLPHWSEKAKEVDFFDLKGIVETLHPGHFVPSNHLTFHPGRQADFYVGDAMVGSLGEIHPAILEKFGIEQRVYYAEVHCAHLLALQLKEIRATVLPQYPGSERDWTISLPLKAEAATLLYSIQQFASPLLEKVEMIDLYLPEGAEKKNITLRFTYRDKTKTVSFEEVEKAHAQIVEHVLKFLAK